MGGWPVDAGLSYALTGQSLPDATLVWAPAGPGPAATAATWLQLALDGNTVHLGRLLAPLGVRYVRSWNAGCTAGIGMPGHQPDDRSYVRPVRGIASVARSTLAVAWPPASLTGSSKGGDDLLPPLLPELRER